MLIVLPNYSVCNVHVTPVVLKHDKGGLSIMPIIGGKQLKWFSRLWMEYDERTHDSYICLRELQNFDGKHEGIHVVSFFYCAYFVPFIRPLLIIFWSNTFHHVSDGWFFVTWIYWFLLNFQSFYTLFSLQYFCFTR